MISRIDAWQRGHTGPPRLFATSNTTHPTDALFSRQFATKHPVSLYGRKFPTILPGVPIRHYLQGHRFDADTARVLGVDFEMALLALQQAGGVVVRPETQSHTRS
jgi:hypothetical protein